MGPQMNKHLTIAVLIGGPSAEHEVSLKTGAMVMVKLDPEKYNVVPVSINKEGAWSISIEDLKSKHAVDVVFIALHGEFGEDGTVQAMLDKAGLPYTGSGAAASKIGMDKIASLELMKREGLQLAKSISLRKEGWLLRSDEIVKSIGELGIPVVLKPADRGSSVGVTIVKDAALVSEAVEHAFTYSNSVIAEEYIEGREVTCGVLDDGTGPAGVIALPPTEIIPKSGTFFDYEAKYTKGASTEITPAPMSADVIAKIQDIALRAHRAIGCAGMSRTDMIVRGAADAPGDTPEIFYLETNTLPGMTETSLLPQGAHAIGIEFPHLLDRLIDAALVGVK
jgi:D-alanine-D-alanine ligase